jgi:hypothetical protein
MVRECPERCATLLVRGCDPVTIVASVRPSIIRTYPPVSSHAIPMSDPCREPSGVVAPADHDDGFPRRVPPGADPEADTVTGYRGQEAPRCPRPKVRYHPAPW